MKVIEKEAELVIEACHGSVAAFEILVEQYEPRIRRMLYGLTQDAQLTQDLCQETFLAAYRALPRMDGEALQFSPWLYRIALNMVRSEWRKRKHVMVVSFSGYQGYDELPFDESGEELLVSEEQFEEQVIQRDLVQRVLAQLPSSSAMCLLLDAEGFSYSEIADMLQDSVSAIRSRLSRARQTFQRIYRSLDPVGKR